MWHQSFNEALSWDNLPVVNAFKYQCIRITEKPNYEQWSQNWISGCARRLDNKVRMVVDNFSLVRQYLSEQPDLRVQITRGDVDNTFSNRKSNFHSYSKTVCTSLDLPLIGSMTTLFLWPRTIHLKHEVMILAAMYFKVLQFQSLRFCSFTSSILECSLKQISRGANWSFYWHELCRWHDQPVLKDGMIKLPPFKTMIIL